MKYGFDAQDNWGMVSRAITQPDGDDGRMFWNKIVHMKVEPGYQYELGHNFPC